jgi:hypothetical protein
LQKNFQVRGKIPLSALAFGRGHTLVAQEVTAKPARQLDLLGRAERSSSNTAMRRAEGAGLDGESSDRALIKVTAMSDIVTAELA